MRLELFVCGNFVPDYLSAVEEEGLQQVDVKSFPCLCINHRGMDEARRLMAQPPPEGVERRVLCSSGCMVLRCAPPSQDAWFRTEGHCFNHLINDQLMTYIVENGGYIITGGWLAQWQARIADYGFDQSTARRFFGEFCRELVFLETKRDPENVARLEALASYLNLPARTMHVGLDNLKVYLRSIVYEWQLGHQRTELATSLQDARRQMAEYAAVLTLVGQMATHSTQRDIVGKLKEVFQGVLGARRVTFTECVDPDGRCAAFCTAFQMERAPEYQVDLETGRLLFRVQSGETCFGFLEADDFLFPGYLRGYASFALSIVRVGALSLSNARQFELLERSRDEATFLSVHDALTGLYNRNFFGPFLQHEPMPAQAIVFIFDVDNLKTVNDQYGHAAGDGLIRGAARILRNAFRDSDIVARIGGDEFFAMIPAGNAELVEIAMHRVLAGIAAYNGQHEDLPCRVDLSMGHAQAWIDGENWEAIIQVADERMYRHKARKKRGIQPVPANGAAG